jgi:hypothetical protein
MQLVTDGALPIPLGSPTPKAMIVEQDRKVRIRELVIDVAGAEAAARAAAAQRPRSPSWMPEHYYSVGQPSGTILVEATSRAELVELMREMAWPPEW